MKELILSRLKQIEKENNVKIILAVESGSRAWGFASPDSDYDVRFIYVRPREDYLKLEAQRDVIQLPIDGKLDINGWDLKKTLRLLYRSNPALFEWLSSPVVYLETEPAAQLRAIMKDYFSRKKNLFHYISMAQNNYREYLNTDTVLAKKYFYVLRPVLACRWVLEKGTQPPMRFSLLASAELPEELKPVLERLLDIKMHSPEVKKIARIDALNSYLDESIAYIGSLTSGIEDADNNPETLNSLFLNVLEHYSEI